MAERSVYYVPQEEERWIGRDREVAEAFWNLGVFLVTSDSFIDNRIKQWKAEGKPLPEWRHNFTFAAMGLGGLGELEPVPNLISDLRCPHCNADIADDLTEIWEAEVGTHLPDRLVACRKCGVEVRSTEAKSGEPFTFSRFYLWVSDIDEEDWDASFKDTVESILGACREYRGWET